MRLPRMTTRQLILTVVVLAVWLAFVARAQRLRGIGSYHMQQYASENRRALDLRERLRVNHRGATADDIDSVRARAARHLKSAEDSNIEADFVESFTLALGLSGLVFGLVWVVRKRRAGPEAGAG